MDIILQSFPADETIDYNIEENQSYYIEQILNNSAQTPT